jgi:hypothetical protein
MLRQSVQYEWGILDEADWERQSGARILAWRMDGARLPERSWFLQSVRGGILVLAALLLTGANFAHQEVSLDWAQAAILPAVMQEQVAWETEDAALLASSIDPIVPDRFVLDWRNGWDIAGAASRYQVELLDAYPQGNLIQATVQVVPATPQWSLWMTGPQRETRFYRKLGSVWLRTLPDKAFWGAQRAVETTNLRFEFADADMAAVIASADEIELAYTQAHSWLGLSLLPTDEKLTFVIVPELVRGWGGYGPRQQLTSPQLAKVSLGLSDADYLRQQIINRIAVRAINDLLYADLQPYDYDQINVHHWRIMSRAVNGWLRTALAGERPPWHQEAETLFLQQTRWQLPLRLTDIRGGDNIFTSDQPETMIDYMLAETVLSYAIDTYGLESLPELILALRNQSSWIGVVRAFRDISLQEFEQGWNAYLAAHYPAMQPAP